MEHQPPGLTSPWKARTFESHISAGALAPVLTDYPMPEAGLYVLRPPGDFSPRKVKALIDILLEYFGDSKS